MYAGAAAPVLCGLAPVVLLAPVPLIGVDTVPPLCEVLARLTLNVESLLTTLWIPEITEASEIDGGDVATSREGPGRCEGVGSRASVDAAAVALFSTVNGSPQVTDCEDERPRRERRVVFRREDDLILFVFAEIICEVGIYNDLVSQSVELGYLSLLSLVSSNGRLFVLENNYLRVVDKS